MKPRRPIPRPIKRKLLLEAGYRCSIPHCPADSALEFHHIDGNPVNNRLSNLLVVCSNHHAACTRRRIDRRACQEIKKTLIARVIRVPSPQITLKRFRTLLRNELGPRVKRSTHSTSTNAGFHSPLSRNHLHTCLLHPDLGYETYMALRAIGSLSYRGSDQLIINAIELIRPKRHGSRRSRFDSFYQAAIESLASIGSAKAVNWLITEFERKDTNDWFRFIILTRLIGLKRARRVVGFRVEGKSVSENHGLRVTETRFRVRGKIVRLRMAYDSKVLQRLRAARQLRSRS